MALLVCHRVRIYPKFLTLRNATPLLSTFPTRYIRTGGNGTDGLYDTPQVRQNSASASITLPQYDSVKKAEQDKTGVDLSKLEKRKTDVFKDKALVLSLACLTTTFDLLTLPLYAAIQRPWKKLSQNKALKGKLVPGKLNEWESSLPKSAVHLEVLEYNLDTLDKLLAHSIQKYSPRICLGTREILGTSEERDSSGNLVTKYDLGDYKWMTYGEVGDAANKLCHGLYALGLRPRDKIGVFAETRADWLITAIAAFKLNLSICTVFATLADDGVVHAINETEVDCLITSDDLMPRIKNILKETPRIKNLIYMDKMSGCPCDMGLLPLEVKVHPLTSLMSLGESILASKSAPVIESPPTPNDTAIIMYTSGSTGVPKGVVLSHWNLVSALRSATDSLASIGDAREDDVYIAYLPLAHALELMCEAMSLLQGIRIGYSSPLTMTDQSLGVKAGSRGDIGLLSPSVLTAVPLVLEKILKGILGKVAERGEVTTTLFNFFYNYKVTWGRRGFETPLVDKIFFGPIRDQVGGRLRLIISGGAPLSAQTQEFTRTVLGCPVVQGYGLTETAGNGCLAPGFDLTVGRVGGPISCNKFRLVDWEEGGYRITDKPYPRGEIYVGGDNVAMGYFKKTDNTDFFDEDGVRWVKTGDIGEVHEDGVFRIIDRKKDLVKLVTGEYISYGKIETTLKSCPYVENICVYADSAYSYPVAVVVASQPKIESLAATLGVSGSYSQLTKEPVIVEAVLTAIHDTAKSLKLHKSEIPRKICISPEVWTPNSGLVTAAFKTKRNNVYSHFHKEIQEMLAQS